MYILVSQTISMPAEFWGTVQHHLNNLPDDDVIKLISVFPNENMDQCVCVWEADSIETLDGYLRNKIGMVSKNSYFQINEANAIGLMI